MRRFAVVYLDDGALDALRPQIETLIEETFGRVDSVLPLNMTTFEVTTNPSRVIPGWGVGGVALSDSVIELAFDAQDARAGSLAAVLEERLPQIVAHELHHTVRARIAGYYGTLLEALVTEGLADVFAVELLGVPPPPWTMAFSEDQLESVLVGARPEYDDPGFDHGAWFFGVGGLRPRWTGYTLGYLMVLDYQRRNGGSAATLVTTTAEAFRL